MTRVQDSKFNALDLPSYYHASYSQYEFRHNNSCNAAGQYQQSTITLCKCHRPQTAITDPKDQPAYHSNSHQGSTNSATRHKSRCHIGPYHTAFLTPYVGLPFLSTSHQGTISGHIPSDSCNALNVCRAQMITSIIQHRACMPIIISARQSTSIDQLIHLMINEPSRRRSIISIHKVSIIQVRLTS